MSRPPRISVAIPVYNEAAIVPELLRRLALALATVPGGPHEVVIVDDGSSDGTVDLLTAAAESWPALTVVALSRNFGHQAALSAALDHVRGDAVILMDGDLQDPPEAIPELVSWYGKGYDVVYVQRRRRKEPWLLRACYFVFYRLMRSMANIDLPVDAGDFGLMSRRVVDQIRTTPERHRYLRGLRRWVGFKQVGVEVERAARAGGESKYSLAKLLRLALDGLFAFSTVPLRAATVLGALAVALSTAFAVFSVIAKLFFDHSPKGFTALITVVTFMSGVNLCFLGVIGEYVGRIFEQVKGRPLYVVDRVIRAEARVPSLSHDGR